MKNNTPVSTARALRNDLYDLLVAAYSPKSKFYTADCDALWAGIMRKSTTELRESIASWRAINATTAAECARHCDTRGIL